MEKSYSIVTDVNDQKLADRFTELMLSDKPVWIARIGGSDYDAFEFFQKVQSKIKENGDSIPKDIYDRIYYHFDRISVMNGFFLKDRKLLLDTLASSCHLYFESLKNNDMCTVATAGAIETMVTNQIITDDFGESCEFISSYSFIEAIEPFFKSFQKWGINKKILIISPFSETIKFQTRKDRLNNLLKFQFPECIFKTYATPVTYNSPGKENSKYFEKKTENYKDWIHLAKKMSHDIRLIDFDVAFISAGIYTMYLGNEIKKQGKKAIYMGGTLNVYFNIYGGRFDTSFFKSFKNMEYEIKAIDEFEDLFSVKELHIENEVLGAYF